MFAPLASVVGVVSVVVLPLMAGTPAVPLLGEPFTAVRPMTVWPRAMPVALVTVMVVLLAAAAVVVVCAAVITEFIPPPVNAPIVTSGIAVAPVYNVADG